MSEKLRFVHVGISVSDLDRSVMFYELLGFERDGSAFVLDWEGFWKEKNTFYELPEGAYADAQYMSSKDSNIKIELFAFKGAKTPQKADWERPSIHHIALQTNCIESIFERLKSAGVSIALPPVKGKKQTFMFVYDPDGNEVEIGQPYALQI